MRTKVGINILAGLLLATMLSDGFITIFIVSHGLATEGNPLLRGWVETDAFLVFKLAIGFSIPIVLWMVYDWYPRLTTTCAGLMLFLYTFVLLWNISFIV